MKIYRRTSAPPFVKYNGEKYLPDHTLTVEYMLEKTSLKNIQQSLRLLGKKCLVVQCVPENLKGENHLYGKDYIHSAHLYVYEK